MKLDTTKVYYLGDLSDEQLQKVLEYLKSIGDFTKFSLDLFKIYMNQDERKSLSYYEELDGWSWCSNENSVNAISLLDPNYRISEIQVRIQELNNELIELDEEMRRLTYDKKEN